MPPTGWPPADDLARVVPLAGGGTARVAPLGDGALTVTLGHVVDLALNARVHALAARLRAAALAGVTDVVPAYAALTLFYEPLHQDADALLAHVAAILAEPAPEPAPATGGREHRVPVVYDGPDLSEVAARTGLTADEVAARHAGRVYTVFLLGFVPGFAYLGELDDALVLPRRAEPRPRVPAGSVAIAGRQTAVYPLATPGGWHLIGRTDLPAFDPAADPPTPFGPGDRVRFVPT